MNELEKIIRVGTIEKDFSILKFKVKIRTLTADEISDIMKFTSGYDDIAKFVMTQIMTLSRSIVSIDDKPIIYAPKDKDDASTPAKVINQNEAMIGKWQKSVVDLFYDKYSELREEQQSFLQQSQTSSEKSGVDKSGKSPQMSDVIKSSIPPAG